MNILMVASPYYVETLIDKETGAKSTVNHRLSEAVMLYNGRYTMMRDALELLPASIPPDHHEAVDLLWFDDSHEEQEALAEIADRYIVLAKADKVQPGQVPPWPDKESVLALKAKLTAAAVPVAALTAKATQADVRSAAMAHWRETARPPKEAAKEIELVC
jgi:hypothetical protein